VIAHLQGMPIEESLPMVTGMGAGLIVAISVLPTRAA